jgi:prepilin peptidase CpaA
VLPIRASLWFLGTAALAGSAAAICDLRSRRIPNTLNLAIMAVALVVHGALEGWHGVVGSLLAALLAGGLFVVFFLSGGMGAGDVKLMTALGAVVGLANVASLLLATAIAGGLLAIGVAVAQHRLGRTVQNLFRMLRLDAIAQLLGPQPAAGSNDTPLYLPYGVAIAAGAATLFGCSTYSALIGK